MSITGFIEIKQVALDRSCDLNMAAPIGQLVEIGYIVYIALCKHTVCIQVKLDILIGYIGMTGVFLSCDYT